MASHHTSAYRTQGYDQSRSTERDSAPSGRRDDENSLAANGARSAGSNTHRTQRHDQPRVTNHSPAAKSGPSIGSNGQSHGAEQTAVPADQQSNSTTRPAKKTNPRPNRATRRAVENGGEATDDAKAIVFSINTKLRQGLRKPLDNRESEYLRQRLEADRKEIEALRVKYGIGFTGIEASNMLCKELLQTVSDPLVFSGTEVDTYLTSQRDKYFDEWDAYVASGEWCSRSVALLKADSSIDHPAEDSRERITTSNGDKSPQPSEPTTADIVAGPPTISLPTEPIDVPNTVISPRQPVAASFQPNEAPASLKRSAPTNEQPVDCKRVKVYKEVDAEDAEAKSPLGEGVNDIESDEPHIGNSDNNDDGLFLPMVDDDDHGLASEDKQAAVVPDAHKDESKDEVRMYDSATKSWPVVEGNALQEDERIAAESRKQLQKERTRLEHSAKVGDLFATQLLTVIDFFNQRDAKRPEVVKNKALSDPASLPIPFSLESRLHTMRIAQWLRIEPLSSQRPGNESWFTENVLGNMVILESTSFHPRAYFYDPALAACWLDANHPLEVRTSVLRNAIKDPQFRNEEHRMPQDMPPDVGYIVLPYCTGNHWVALKIEPDLNTRKGRIHLFDSSNPHLRIGEIQQIIPLFAKLLDSRGCRWNQETWTVIVGQSTTQRNHTDCGPLTARNCIDLSKGQLPTVVGRRDVDNFGLQLRYDFLKKLLPQLIKETASSASPQGSNDLVTSNGHGHSETKSPIYKTSVKPLFEPRNPSLSTAINNPVNDMEKDDRDHSKIDKRIAELMTQQQKFDQKRNTLRSKADSKRDIFAEPLLQLMEYCVECAREKDLQPWNVPLTLKDSEAAPVYLSDLLNIYPTDNAGEHEFEDGWASAALLDFLVIDLSEAIQRGDHRSYIPLPLKIHQFVKRHETSDTEWTVSEMTKQLQQAKNEVEFYESLGQDFKEQDPWKYIDTFAVGEMPVETLSLSLMYNWERNHWVHVNIKVDAAKSTGTIQVQDSRSQVKRAARNLQEISIELKLLVQLISLRPDLGWQDVKWDDPVATACPQQSNGSDCGFFANYCARKTALGEELHTGLLASQDAVITRAMLRWDALGAIFRQLLKKDLHAFPSGEFMASTTSVPAVPVLETKSAIVDTHKNLDWIVANVEDHADLEEVLDDREGAATQIAAAKTLATLAIAVTAKGHAHLVGPFNSAPFRSHRKTEPSAAIDPRLLDLDDAADGPDEDGAKIH